MRRKIVFVYNVFMNLVAFVLLFPSDASGRTLYWEDVFPLDLAAMVEEADYRLEKYRDVRLQIKNSSPYEENWVFAEYALEQARLHTVARALTLSPAKLYCERASGRVWLDICLAHLLPVSTLYSGIDQNIRDYNPEYVASEPYSPNAYLRDFDYSLWFCYYNQNYALYHLKQSFYYLQFDSYYQEHLFTEAEEYQALLLNSVCLEPAETNLSLGFKVGAFKMHYSGERVEYGCYQQVLPKAALAYYSSFSDLRHEQASPVPCGKILGYLESAGLGDIHEDKVVRFYTWEYLKRYPLPLAGREALCE